MLLKLCVGPSWPWSYGSWFYRLCNQYLSPLMLWFRISIRARCETLCDKVCQWLATGRWFSPGPPVSLTNKTNRHNITEMLKVALNTIKQTNKKLKMCYILYESTLLYMYFAMDILQRLLCYLAYASGTFSFC